MNFPPRAWLQAGGDLTWPLPFLVHWGQGLPETGDADTWLITAVRGCFHDYCGAPYIPFIGSQMQHTFFFFLAESSVQDYTPLVIYPPVLVGNIKVKKVLLWELHVRMPWSTLSLFDAMCLHLSCCILPSQLLKIKNHIVSIFGHTKCTAAFSQAIQLGSKYLFVNTGIMLLVKKKMIRSHSEAQLDQKKHLHWFFLFWSSLESVFIPPSRF